MSETPLPSVPPTLPELQALAALCSDHEWQTLLRSHGFIAASAESVAAMESFMSRRLGRTISLAKPCVKNSGDPSL